MLTITVGGTEQFDEATETFTNSELVVVNLEHSLVSVSKWESKYGKAFLGRDEKTNEETIDYIRMMILPPSGPEVMELFTYDTYNQIIDYIKEKQTATTFHNAQQSGGFRETITSELIYYWMITNNVPIEMETWNLNRLFTLLQVFAVKNGKQKKMSRSEIAARNRELNAQRRAELGTTG